ncbi:DNA-binding protein [Streptomyces sp. AA1529]|uniref:DNA-binding protein n=1 Tax=Streptomyces sp. AA1529 TaxID=1203257 RepID=UPI0003629ACF|nr:DNA-binding protein [Streptomyces sp. AA1529]
MPRTTPSVLPQLFRPEEVATAFGVSEWWVKEQALRRRIPFTRVGNAYRFTAEHHAEIVRLFEQRPERQPDEVPEGTPIRRSPASLPAAATRLRARPPRRSLRAA